ncbi:unnamed protein product [Medioppia subpectinata]|uniref:Oxaloacetate tautomerase FAHD1, mitochondrial n=1 Tax=Medioppia subpectinata TaxID=1979941 RepID=A0A7R9PTX1_9ACAR|nr:unnamed protein product [Medioppia subpectinata]CAG2101004.1 unnamed protein product [Medioppia subpectinata]
MRLTRFVEFGRKIVCLGKNYGKHAIEMGGKVPEVPLIFLKPATAYVTEGNPIKVPVGCGQLHHEVELGVIIGRKGSNISESEAMDYVGGYAVTLDMTARDWQSLAKKEGNPWSLAKGFDTSCPVGSFIPKEAIGDPNSLQLWCKVNGDMKQNASTSDMVFKIPQIISYISKYFTLETGDLILTGTPEGVGPVSPGDTIEAGLGDLSKVSFQIQANE